MKSLIIAVVLLSTLVQTRAQYFTDETRRANRWSTILRRSLNDIDFAPLRAELDRRQPDLDDAEARRLMRRNLFFVIDNQLNRRRMLVAPRAQTVVDEMARLLELTRRISERVAAGRRMAVEHRKGSRPVLPLALVREVGELADEIGGGFQDNFVELRDNKVSVGVADPGAPYACFVYFLLEVDRLQKKLEATLRAYFLAPDPGVVAADDFSQGSVMALSKGLEWISEETSRNLRKYR